MRTLAPLLLALVSLALVAGCGGGNDAPSGADVDRLLEETFSGDERIESGRLDLTFRAETEDAAGGPVAVELSGPFQGQDGGALPRFAIQAEVEAGGRSFQAGAISTGDAGYVSFQNEHYELSSDVFAEFRRGYEQARGQEDGEQRSLASLGIDPRDWVTNARVAGTADVGEAETTRITGGVDVPALLDDVDALLAEARSLGLSQAQGLPERLSQAQRREAVEAVRDPRVEIYTGTDDRILRRLVVATRIEGRSSADLRLDLQLLEVNEDQEIEAPADPRPFAELLEGLGGLGLGGGGAGAGGASRRNLEAYSRCIEQAGTDSAAARECADLLTP